LEISIMLANEDVSIFQKSYLYAIKGSQVFI
jgi:hypothetical protein